MTVPVDPDQEPSTSGMIRKTGVAVAGGAVTAAGVVMLVTPGPGLVAIAVGLGILGTEFKRPRRMLDRVKAKLTGADT